MSPGSCLPRRVLLGTWVGAERAALGQTSGGLCLQTRGDRRQESQALGPSSWGLPPGVGEGVLAPRADLLGLLPQRQEKEGRAGPSGYPLGPPRPRDRRASP